MGVGGWADDGLELESEELFFTYNEEEAPGATHQPRSSLAHRFCLKAIIEGRSAVTITVPDDMRQNLEARAKSAGFDRIDDYVEEMIASDQLSVDLASSPTQARLKELVDEAMSSGPAAPITAEFWERLNFKVTQQHEAAGQ
jgi:hypothetical protein